MQRMTLPPPLSLHRDEPPASHHVPHATGEAQTGNHWRFDVECWLLNVRLLILPYSLALLLTVPALHAADPTSVAASRQSAANSATNPPPPATALPAEQLSYHTDARWGRTLFIRNDAAQPTPAEVARRPAATPAPSGALFNRDDLARPEWTNAVATARDFLRRHARDFLDVAAPRQSAAVSGTNSQRRSTEPPLRSAAAPANAFDPDTDLTPVRAERDALGMTHVRFAQTFHGLPVFGADASVHLAPDGRVSSAGARLVPDGPAALQPTLNREQAVNLAVAAWQAQFNRKETPETSSAVLCILAPGLLKNDGNPNTYLVWEVKLLLKCSDSEKLISAEDYYLDAHTGELREHLSEFQQIDRKLYDCSQPTPPGDNSTCNRVVIGSYRYGRYEALGDGPSGPNPLFLPGEMSIEVDILWDKLNDIHQFYQDHFRRNGASNQGGSGDNGGTYLPTRTYGITYLDYAPGWATACPNAAHSKGSVYFCKDFIQDDVVEHEYAHAVVLWSHVEGSGKAVGMVYQGESGALNESHSDVMGEMYELTKNGACDWMSAGVTKWGESLQRSLCDPPSRSTSLGFRADRFCSLLVYCGSDDSGGVHQNSTIPSKAAWLLSLGGSFNGCTISPLGEAKVEQIVYRAVTQYYAQTETFNGAYPKWIQAATDLYGVGSEEVRQTTRALQAVELDQPGYCSGLPPRPPQALDVEGW